MAFDPRQHDIEEWLRLEDSNLLQKVCNILDVDGYLVGQYKTRVYIVPVGNQIPNNTYQLSVTAPSLFRSFNYDDEGNAIASLPEIREWTQACEDLAQGADPGDNPIVGVPAGLKVANATYDYGLASSVPAGASVVVVSKQLLPGEAIYLRHVPISGDNRARFRVDVNGSPKQGKRLWWMAFNDDFWFNTANGGILYKDEELIRIVVTNLGVDVADFESSIGYVIK